MVFDYNIEKLYKALRDFSNATGVNIGVIKDDFTSIEVDAGKRKSGYCSLVQSAKEGKRRCHHSDMMLLEKCRETKKVQSHVCHSGLVDICVPVIHDGIIMGYIILGELKKDEDFKAIEKRIEDLPLDFKKLKNEYEKLICYDEDRIESIISLATMLVGYILFEKMMNTKRNKTMEKAEEFINANLDKRLSVELITSKTNTSKSVLYKNFRKYHGCTVSEYINRMRVLKSEALLADTDLSMEEISRATGFSGAAYFAFNFRKQKGMSPTAFRKMK